MIKKMYDTRLKMTLIICVSVVAVVAMATGNEKVLSWLGAIVRPLLALVGITL